jgi:haloalkane dehalogenase
LIEQVAEERRCVAPDAMGLGYTEVASKQDLTPAAQTDMLIAFLESLAIDQVDLVANYKGGAIAQLFLSRHPERVRTLLLTNCDIEIQSPAAALLPIIKFAQAGLYPEPYLKAVARGQGLGALADRGARRDVLHGSRASDRCCN